MEQHKEHHKLEEHKTHHKTRKTLSKSFYTKVYIVLGIALVIFAGYNIIQGASFGSLYNQELAKAKEAARPAIIELVTIDNDDCNDCFDIGPIIDSIKKANANVTEERTLDISSNEAKELISKYDIEKIPTIIVFGEIDKLSIRDLEKKDDALLFTQLTLPYTDAETFDIMGRVSAIILEDASCDKCVNLGQIIDVLKQSGIKIVSEKVIERNTSDGEKLINKYSLDILPSLILSKDLGDYDSEITKGWGSVGSIENDGSYVTRISNPPYLNLTTGKVEGLVSMTVLIDKSCEGCYDPDDFHKPILQRMGVVFGEEKRVDISDSEGKSLIEKYGIEKVPTIILKGDVEKYPILVGAWADVGSVEPDGTYVFRKVEVAKQTYKDINTNKIIEPTTAS